MKPSESYWKLLKASGGLVEASGGLLKASGGLVKAIESYSGGLVKASELLQVFTDAILIVSFLAPSISCAGNGFRPRAAGNY